VRRGVAFWFAFISGDAQGRRRGSFTMNGRRAVTLVSDKRGFYF
jgi:hypothetical protein